MRVYPVLVVGFLIILLVSEAFSVAGAPETPEDVLRALVRANAERDLASMELWMARDSDTIGYTVGGRKYIGWPDFARDLQQEFHSVERLEIPISDLNVWTRGDIAWFTMELDYIRYTRNTTNSKIVIPLRETGVLERRNGRWILVAWHESSRTGGLATVERSLPTRSMTRASNTALASLKPDLSGQWDIQEEDKSYVATLDQDGNGGYTWQHGEIATTSFEDHRWQGTWRQPGNDREGGFDVLLSDDGTEAKGVWWYSRVGDRNNIPPRQWGGSYIWKRLTATPNAAQ